MKRRQTVGIIRAIAMVMLTATTIFTATYFLAAFVFQKMGQQPAPLVAYLVNIVLGLVFCFSIATGLGAYFGARRREHLGPFGPIFEAMQKIAKGDFSVRVDNPFADNPLMSTLATNVNNMALELSQLETMRQEFISNVSHELQSPLTSIRGFAKALQNDHLGPEERRHYLDIIETECTRLSRITENLLRLASLETKQAKFEPKPYRLDKQIRNLVLACEPQWTTKQIEMEVALEEVETTADEDLLSQVWLNLIHNSLKFTGSGGKVCIDLRRQNGDIEFKIADSGVGISEADRDHIFERFYKADKSRTRSDTGGSGLGLSIAHKIVEMHNGTIAVDSKPGAGTTFVVCLPAQPK